MENLVGALIVSGISALTFIAYRHPEAFKRILWPTFWTVAALMLAASIWDVSNVFALGATVPFLGNSKFDAAKTATEAIQIPFLWLMPGGCLFLFYLGLLSALPVILGEQKPVQKKGDGKGDGAV